MKFQLIRAIIKILACLFLPFEIVDFTVDATGFELDETLTTALVLATFEPAVLVSFLELEVTGPA